MSDKNFNWDDYPPESKDSFNWEDYPVEGKKKPDVSMLESAGRGLAQGGSLGFGDELSGAAGYLTGKLGLTPDMGYDYYRDYARKKDAEAQAANPNSFGAGVLGGTVLTSAIPGLNIAKGSGFGSTIGKSALQSGLASAGSTTDDLASLEGLKDVGTGLVLGGAGGAAGFGLAKGLEKGAPAASNLLENLGNKFKGTAENLAEKATGATGVQSAKFADNAGRELLDRGLVKFGDTPEKIAARTAEAQLQSGRNIGSALESLDTQGAKVNLQNVVDKLNSKIEELNQVPGNEKIIRDLKKEVENLSLRSEQEIPLSLGEKAKRNYQSQVNYNSPESEKNASKSIASAFRQEVENSATQANPDIAKQFMEDKKIHGLLDPIVEAAEKRANQLKQSPFGGLGDTAAAAAGAVANPTLALPAAVGRRLIAPRAASSAAVGMDKIGDVLKQSPQIFGKFAPVLQQAAQRGPQGLAATHFILQQTQPEYQQRLLEMNGMNDN